MTLHRASAPHSLRVLWVLGALSLFASACTSDSGDSADQPSADASRLVVSDGSEGRSGDEAGTSPGPGEPDPDFDYATVDYDAEPVGDALTGDRTDPAFPPPLVAVSGIVAGGPPPDGIPPLDEPDFVSVEEASDFMESDDEAIIVVTVEDETRGFPVRIMTWHELVNDEVGGVPVTVSYCPLCNSALAYHRTFGGRVLDFGTSGELYQSAMVMYDRQTRSLWSHFVGRGLVGHYAGAQLDLIAAQTISWATFRESYPDALVLSEDTGFDRNYGRNPYAGYDNPDGSPIEGFVSGTPDARLAAMTRVVGIVGDEAVVAVPLSTMAERRVMSVPDGDRTLVVFHQDGLASALDAATVAGGEDVGQTGVYVARAEDGSVLTFDAVDGGFVDVETSTTWDIGGRAIRGPLAGRQLERVVHLDTFWFAWSVYRPTTILAE